MKPTRTANDIIHDSDGPDYGYQYKADSLDLDNYLKEISGDGYEEHRAGIMDCVRDDLEDKYGAVFTLAACADNPASPASLDLLSVVNGIVRNHAAKQLEFEVQMELVDREGYDPGDDAQWEYQEDVVRRDYHDELAR